MRKELIASILVLCLCISTFIGCANSKDIRTTGEESVQRSSSKELSVVCTIFPQYDWVKEILGTRVDQAELTLLMDNGVDLHNYQPTAKDIAAIDSCDLFIYVGGESDQWVKDALAGVTNKDTKVINMLEVLGNNIKEEEVVEGMEAEEEHSEEGHKHGEEVHGDIEEGYEDSEEVHEDSEVVHADSEEGHVDSEAVHADGEEEAEYDEHVWLSIENAKMICNAISSALSDIDTQNRETYEKNLLAYEEKLADLDRDYKNTVESAAHTTLLFGDRFPFRYLVDDYGLDYYAAFLGCSAETEASFETIVFLAEKTEELKLPAICVLESSNQDIAKTIIRNTRAKNQKVLVLDSMQSVTAEDVEKGDTYLSIMQQNLAVLKEALN